MIDRGTVHVVPVGDLIEHEAELNSSCPCGPELQAVMREDGSCGWVYVHHALDGRELAGSADA